MLSYDYRNRINRAQDSLKTALDDLEKALKTAEEYYEEKGNSSIYDSIKRMDSVKHFLEENVQEVHW